MFAKAIELGRGWWEREAKDPGTGEAGLQRVLSRERK